MQDRVSAYEARLRPVKSGKLFFRPRGKVEYRREQGGRDLIKLSVHHIGIRDKHDLACTIAGKAVLDFVVNNGHGKAELSAARGESVPPIAVGDVVEIYHQGKVLLSGTFSRSSLAS